MTVEPAPTLSRADAERLTSLMDAHPACATVGAACHASGTTLGAYLAS